MGRPYVVVSVEGGVTVADRQYLDYHVHFYPDDGDEIMEIKEDGRTKGFTYFLYHCSPDTGF